MESGSFSFRLRYRFCSGFNFFQSVTGYSGFQILIIYVSTGRMYAVKNFINGRM